MIEFKANIKKLINCLLSGPLYQLVRSLALSNEVPYNGDLAFLDSASPRPEHMLQPVCMNDEVLFDISVIIPVYNVENYLKDCLDSVVSQSIDGTYEVIIVNDGSTDNSGAIAHLYAHGSNIQVVDQSNGGLSAARNAGLRLSRGKYIMFVDSDDALAPGYLRAMKDRLDRTSADYVTSTFRYMSDDGMLGEQEKDRASWMAPWGRLYRRCVWDGLCFPVGAWYEDLVQSICIEPKYKESKCYDLDGYNYRIRPGSIMQSTPTSVKGLDSFWVLDELISWRSELNIAFSNADYDRILPLFGPLLLGRTVALDHEQRHALFEYCCSTFCSIEEFRSMNTRLPDCWGDIELSLRTSNYRLYLLAAMALASDVNAGLAFSDALNFYLNRTK